MVIWLFGLSGAGKTTISKYLFKKLKQNNPQIVLIDNDEIREVLGTENLGFDAESRIIKAKKIQKLALMLSNQNLIVIVCVTFSNKEISNWNRENFKTYYEIFLDVSINLSNCSSEIFPLLISFDLILDCSAKILVDNCSEDISNEKKATDDFFPLS